MGWFLWGVALGWAACAIYAHTQRGQDDDATGNGATLVFFLIVIVALFISISLGVQSGVIKGAATPTPTFMGR